MEEELEDEEGCSMISCLSACYWHWQTLIGECSRVHGTAVVKKVRSESAKSDIKNKSLL